MKRVLVVDDEPLSATVVEMFLQDRGYVVASANSGGEAQAVALEFRPDVLLTDYRLGDMSAAELIRAMRAQNPELRALILTGLPPDQVQLDGIEAVTVFTKPTELDEIADAIAASTPA